MSKASDYAAACQTSNKLYPPEFKDSFGLFFCVTEDMKIEIHDGEKVRTITDVGSFIHWLHETFEEDR